MAKKPAKKKPITAIEAARLMMRAKGYVVVGFPGAHRLKLGDTLETFAGGSLEGAQLKLVMPATRAEFEDESRLIFGSLVMDAGRGAVEGETFYRCALVYGGKAVGR